MVFLLHNFFCGGNIGGDISLYNQNFFDDIDSPVKAYFLGLALADATIRKYAYRSKFIYDFEFNPVISDIDIMRRFSNETGAPIHVKRCFTHKRVEPYVTAVVQMKNKHVVETLMNYFGGDKKDLRVTYPVLDESLMSHFTRGYFDGDGSLYESGGRWELSFNGRQPILEKIRDNLDLSTNITDDKSIKRMRIRKKDDIRKVIGFMYRDVNTNENPPLYLVRKYEKAKAAI